jgi:hypothetical protein
VIQLTEVVGTVAAEGDDLVGRLHSPLTTYKMAEASLITLSRTATALTDITEQLPERAFSKRQVVVKRGEVED